MGKDTGRRRRRRPDQAPGHPGRRVDGRARPGGRVPRPRRRRDDLGRHRRRRHRQGPRLLRGRDDARAVPGRRARAPPASRCSGCTPPARSAGRRPSWPASSSRPASTSGCSPWPSRSSPRARPCGRCRCRCRSPRRCTPAPAATSPRTSAATCARSGSPDHIGILVALKDRQNALKNPYAHLHEHDITFDSIKDSMMLWDPIRYAETCPSSDGACAMVLGSEAVAERRCRRAPAGVGARARRCAPSRRCRPTATPCCPSAAPTAPPTCTRRPASPTPAREVDCVEMYVPFSLVRADVAREPRVRRARRGLEDGRGGRHAARRRPAGEHVRRRAVVQPDRRVRACSASPRRPCRCGARAGEHQVDGARTAVGHAYGGGSQFFAMWVVGADKP